MQRVFGLGITPSRMDELVETIASAERARAQLVFTMNVDHVVQMRRNPCFRDAYATADIVTIDGAPVLAYARARGAAVEKISGSDLFERLVPRLLPGCHRLLFVLSSEMLCRAMKSRLGRLGFSDEALAFEVPPRGFEFDLPTSRALARRIRGFEPTHVFFCVGSPKSELWCVRHRDALGQARTLCVGASVEFYLGIKRRAPVAVQRLGFEWLWRWGQEPRRLFRRYFVTSWGFLGAIWQDARHGGG